jgi:hypothetical protein
MEQVVTGAIAMGYGVAGLFFLRFWRKTRDRLFALFALALFVLSLNRVGSVAFAGAGGGAADLVYWVRFAAFALILAAIVDKNRPRTPRPPGPGHSSPVTTRPRPVTPPTRPPAPG